MSSLLESIDRDIARLEQARALLSEDGTVSPGSAKKKNKMTPEGRARIAEAQRKRWAARKA